MVQSADNDELDLAASLAREVIALRSYMISHMYAEALIYHDKERSKVAAKLHLHYRTEHQPESQRLLMLDSETARLRFLEIMSDLESTSDWNRNIEGETRWNRPLTNPNPSARRR